jgi:hypothetical protein
MLNMLKHVGAHVACENDDVTPLGSPVTDRTTGRAAPVCSVAVIIVAPEFPCTSVTVPPFVSEKSNGGGVATGPATGGGDRETEFGVGAIGAVGAGAEGEGGEFKIPPRAGAFRVIAAPSAKTGSV